MSSSIDNIYKTSHMLIQTENPNLISMYFILLLQQVYIFPYPHAMGHIISLSSKDIDNTV